MPPVQTETSSVSSARALNAASVSGRRLSSPQPGPPVTINTSRPGAFGSV